MIKSLALSLGMLSSPVTNNSNIISNTQKFEEAQQELTVMKEQYIATHKLDTELLIKTLRTIYSNEAKVNSQHLMNLKDGRNGYKTHWYGSIEVWVNEEAGGRIDEAITGGGSIAEIAEILGQFLELGPASAVVLAAAAIFAIEWEIVWRNTDAGRGIHMEIVGGIVVYAHAQ